MLTIKFYFGRFRLEYYFAKIKTIHHFIMKLCKILLLLGLYFTSTESTFDILTTSHTEQSQSSAQRKTIKPKEHFCSENKIEKLKCAAKSKNACKNVSSTQKSPICGFDSLGVKFDFNRQCEACQNSNIQYYFMGTCKQTPTICSKTEECINGLCVEILQQADDANREICNTKADCSSIAHLCVANKCIDKRDLIAKLKKVEKTHPGLAAKAQKVKKQAIKFEGEIKKKDKQEYEKLKAVNKAKLQSSKSTISSTNTTSTSIASQKAKSQISSN